MKLKTIFAAALCFAAIQISSFAQKTEVSVQKGKVAAETEKGTFNIDAGRKAVLEKNDAPKVFVDDPIVQDLLEMYKWVQAEKDANLIRIDSVSIQIVSIENDQLCKGAGYNECPNEKNEPSKTCEITGTLILEKNKIYDLEGNLLTFDMKPISKTNCNIYIHFQKEIEPGEKFKFICVGESKPSLGFWKQGNLWHHVMENNPRYCVNYFRVILPKSAIFVESNRNILTSGIIDGRVAITTRNYTGENARGLVHSTFLWPEKDGTSLADLAEGFSTLGKNDLSQFNSERENVTKKLGSIPWDKADKQVLDLYNQFVIKKIDSSGDWFVLGIKLVGGGYWEQALNSFESSTNLAKEKINPDYVSSIIWQGHVLDIVNKRDQAIAKYKEVLDFMEQFRGAQELSDFENYVFMRHDQWDIKLTYNWVKERLEKPFTEKMLQINIPIESQRSPNSSLLIEQYHQVMSKILAGEKYTDQSTPLGAVLTYNCALVNKDEDLYLESTYLLKIHPNAKNKIKDQNWDSIKKYFVDELDFLSTPEWPQKPENGYIHPVYVCNKGTSVRADTLACVFYDGKWYRFGNIGNSREWRFLRRINKRGLPGR